MVVVVVVGGELGQAGQGVLGEDGTAFTVVVVVLVVALVATVFAVALVDFPVCFAEEGDVAPSAPPDRPDICDPEMTKKRVGNFSR